MDRTTQYDRIERLARKAGEERSLYMGEAIGSALASAWKAIDALVSRSRRPQGTAPAAPAR